MSHGEPVTWEYKILDFTETTDSFLYLKFLNDAGREGWELVSAFRLHAGTCRYVFKRVASRVVLPATQTRGTPDAA